MDDKEAKLKEEYADTEKVIPKPYYGYILVRKLSFSDWKFLGKEKKVTWEWPELIICIENEIGPNGGQSRLSPFSCAGKVGTSSKGWFFIFFHFNVASWSRSQSISVWSHSSSFCNSTAIVYRRRKITCSNLPLKWPVLSILQRWF